MEQQPDKKMVRSYTIFFIFITAILSIWGILLFVLPQHTYSENENRYLTTFQPVTFTGFMDMSLQKNLTDGANDQFWARDSWMKLATDLQRTVGFQDAGGVYLGKNGYYFERILNSQISDKRFENNLRYIEQFASEWNVDTSFLPVPSSGTILKDQLPEHAVLYDADRLYQWAASLLQQTKLLDIRSILSQEKKHKQIYFKTDHHWTMNGAYLAYSAWCKANAIPKKELSHFSPKCVSHSFYGTLYSKAPCFHIQPDLLYIPANLTDVKITIDSKTSAEIYDMDKLKTKDKYGVYFGGNFGRIDIQPAGSSSTKDSQPKKLLVIKDSFANSLVPFLLEHYDEIIMLDLRYYNDSIAALMQTEHPSDILVLYEISNFAQDMNLFKILK